MSELSEKALEILSVADQHDGQYMLRQRYRSPNPWDEKTQLDHEYDACRELVNARMAQWLGESGPGIRIIRRAGP